MADVAEEVELVRRVLEGDGDAFAVLVREYETRVRGYCIRMLDDREAAEDAAQEVFLKAYRNLSSFRQESRFSTWLYRIAANHCIDAARKRRIRSIVMLSKGERDETTTAIERFAEPSPNAGETLEARNLLNLVLSSLSAGERSLILLRESHGLSYEELAETLGCSVDSIKSKLKRVRKKLLAARDRLSADRPLDKQMQRSSG